MKELLINEEERYIEFTDYADEGELRAAFAENASARAGFTADISYRGITPHSAFMREIGAEQIDADVKLVLRKEGFKPAGNIGEEITLEGFERFAAVHDRRNPDMYWSARRVRDDWGDWLVMMDGDDYVLAATWKPADIYALSCEDGETAVKLLGSACNRLFAAGHGEIWFFAGEREAETAFRLGFSGGERHYGYRVIIN